MCTATDVRVNWSGKLKIPTPVMVSAIANLLIRDIRSRGELSIESVVNSSSFASKLRGKPVETLAELIARLENPLPTDYWPGVEYGLILLIMDIVRASNISIPKDVWQIDRKHLLEWFKWVRVWCSSAS